MRKKILLLLFLVAAGTSFIQGQEIAKNAIGVRISETVDGDEGPGLEFSYQWQVLSEHTRLDFNASLRSNSFIRAVRTGAYFHWSYNIWDRLYWYGGPGVGAAFIRYGDPIFINGSNVDRGADIFPFVGIDFGVDYRFEFPLQVSFGFRPTLGIHEIESTAGFRGLQRRNVNVGIAARYTF